MNRRPMIPAMFAALCIWAGIGSPLSGQTTFAWTGLGADQDIYNGANWQGGTVPTFSGSEDLILGKAINNSISISGDISVNSISLTGNDSYHFTYYVDPTITIGNGVGNGIYGSLSGSSNRLVFDSTIGIAGTGTLNMDAGNSFIVISGKITGSADLILSNARGGTTGAFIFNDTCTGSSYTGDTYITGIAGTPVVVAFWNDQPFGDGTGTLFIQNSAQLIAHGSREVESYMVFNTTLANDPIYFKSWDDTLYLDGDITLANHTTLVAQLSQAGVPSADNSGIFPVPGPRPRNAIEIDGAIDESGGSRSLTVNGAGVMVFDGNNTYTGGTTVNGSLVFGSTISAPSGVNKVKVNAAGYAGFADNTPGHFATFLNTKIDKVNSSGAVGVDTYPGDSTYTFTDNINLSGFTNPGIRIGTATSAIITGTITPQGYNYQFGNGGGSLYV
jgi:autotransporter-associated beta strand protein